MTKTVLGGLLLAGLVAIGYVMMPVATAQQQDRTPAPRGAWDLALEGPGSSIGVTVRDQSDGAGVLIESVREGTPATRAGLQKGDVIVEFDGERVRSARQFSRLVAESPSGRSVKLGAVRDGQRVNVDITPDTRADTWAFGDDLARLNDLKVDIPPIPKIAVPGFEFKTWTHPGRLGVQIDTLTPQLATYFGVKRGALVTNVDEGSAAEKAGLKAGDVITAIDGRTVEDSGDIQRALRDTEDGAEVSIAIVRDRKEQTLKAKLEPTAGARKTRRRVVEI
jgi:serine protease Do